MKKVKRMGMITGLCILLVMSFFLGTMTQVQDTYAAPVIGTQLGNLANAGDYQEATAVGTYTFIATRSRSPYLIELWAGAGAKGQNYTSGSKPKGGAGGKGSYLQGIIHMEPGDTLYFRHIEGGKILEETNNRLGGEAGATVEVSVVKSGYNDVLAMVPGSGGGGGGAYYYYGPGPGEDGLPSTEIIITQNDTGTYGKGTDGGSAIPGTPPTGGAAGVGGNNYINKDLVKNYSVVGGSSSTWKIKITALDSPSVESSMEEVASEIIKLTEAVAKIGSNGDEAIEKTECVPLFAVQANVNFSITHAGYDDMESASYQGVTVTNTSKADGIIVVSGKISDAGTYRVVIGGKLFMFKVLSEPAAANVKVTFD